MGDYRIKATIDLDDGDAKGKLKDLQDEKIKAHLDLDGGAAKKSMDDIGKYQSKLDQKLALEKQKHQNKLAQNEQKHLQKLEQERVKTENKRQLLDEQLSKKRQAWAEKEARNEQKRAIRMVEQQEKTRARLMKQARGNESYEMGLNSNSVKAYRNYGNEILRLNRAYAKEQDKISQRQIQNDINKRVKAMDSIRANATSIDPASYKIFDGLDKSLFNITRGKGLEKAFGNAYKQADKLYNKTQSISGQFAKSFVPSLQKDLSNIFQSVERNKFTPANASSLSARVNRSNREFGQLQHLDKVETKVRKQMGRIQDVVNDGFSNPILQRQGDSLFSNLNKQMTGVLTKDLNSTVSNIDKFDNSLGHVQSTLKKMGQLDKASSRIEGLSGFLKPREINSLKKDWLKLNKAHQQGSDRYVAQHRQLQSKIDGMITYRRATTRFKTDLRNSFMGMTPGFLLGDGIRRTVGGMIQAYKELDVSTTNIKKVADPADVRTTKQLDNIRKAAIKTAKDVGMSSADVQNSIATALQSGMGSMKASAEVARKSMILANVGDMNKEDASAAVNTIVKSFNLNPLAKMKMNVRGVRKETTQLAESMDILNHLGNNYAISSAGVAEALQVSGGVMHAYGVSLRDSAALITAANEPLQDPSKVGNGLRTIAMRMAGVASSAKDGTIKTNQTAKALKTIAGIDIYSDKKAGKIKSMIQVFDELMPKWKNFTDEQRYALGEALAGKNRANVLMGLMNNYDQFKKIRNELANGEHFGSAEAENAKYVNSLAGKINTAKESFTSLATTLVNTKMAYGALDGFNAIVNGLERVVTWSDKANITLPALLTGYSMVKGIMKGISGKEMSFEDIESGKSSPSSKRSLAGRINSWIGQKAKMMKSDSVKYEAENKKIADKIIKSDKENFKDAQKGNFKLKDISTPSSSRPKKDPESTKKFRSIKRIPDISPETTKGIDKAGNSIKQMGKASEGATPKVGKLRETFGRFKESGFVSGVKEVSKSIATGAAEIATGMALTAAVSFAATKAIEFGVDQYREYTGGVQKSKDALLEKNHAIHETSKGLKQNIGWVKQNGKSYDDLVRATNKFKRSPIESWTEDQRTQMETLGQYTNKIAEMFPSLVKGYDQLGNAELSASATSKNVERRLNNLWKANERLRKSNEYSIAQKNATLMLEGEKGGENAGSIWARTGQLQKEIKSLKNIDKSKFDNGGLAYTGLKDKSTERALKNNMFASSGKDFLKAKKDFFANDERITTEANQKYAKWSEEIAKYDRANQYNTQHALERMGDKNRYKHMSDGMKESIQDLASSFTWGKIKRPDDAFNHLFKLDKLPTQQVQGFADSIRKLNNEYSIDKDYEKYSKGIDGLAKSIAKAAGEGNTSGIRKWKEMLKDVNRGFADADEAREFNFLKRNGYSFADLEGDNQARALAADNALQRFRELRSAMKDIGEAGNDTNKLKNAFEAIRDNDALPKVMRNMAKTGDVSEGMQKAMLSYADVVNNFDRNNSKHTKGLKELGKALDSGKASAIDFGNGMKMSAKDVQSMIDAGIKSKDVNFDIKPNVSQQQLDNVEKFYKDKKIELDADVKLKIADANLTEKQLEGLEKATSKIAEDKKDIFRGNAAKYAQGTDGSDEAIFRNMAKDVEGWRTAIDSGAADQVGQYSDKVNQLNKAFNDLSPNMKNAVKQMSDTNWRDYLETFDKLQGGVRGLATEFNATNVGQLNALSGLSDTWSKLGFGDGEITKAIRVAVVSGGGVENLPNLLDTINSFSQTPDIQKNILLNLTGADGANFAQGLNSLFNAAGGDSEVITKTIQFMYQNDGNLDKLKNMSDEEIIQYIRQHVDSSEVDRAKAENEKESTHTVKEKYIPDPKRNVHPEKGKHFSVAPNGGKYKYTPPAEATSPLKTEVKAKVTVDTSSLKSLDTLKSKNIEVKVKVGGADSANKAKRAISGLKSKTVTVKANDNASSPARKASSAVNAFPMGTKTATLRAVDRASGPARAAASAVRSFPTGTRTVSLITRHITITSVQGGNGGPGATGSVPPNGGRYRYKPSSSLPVTNTQLNPLASMPVGQATIQSGQSGNTSGIYGGYASMTAIPTTNLDLVESFKTMALNGYAYKGITQVNRLVYTAKEIQSAFKEDVNVLHEFERAVHRVGQAIKHLDVSIANSRGARKSALMALQEHMMREKIRRLDGEMKVATGMRNTYRTDLRKQGDSFTPDGSITNYYEKELADKKKIHALEEKMEKVKGKNADKQKKKIKDEIEAIQKKMKMRESYEKMQDTISDADLEKKELNAKIENNAYERWRMQIEAFSAHYEAVTTIVENSIKKVVNSLDILGIQQEWAFGMDRLANIDAQISKMNEMKKTLDSSANSYGHLKDKLKTKLSAEGFKFDGDNFTNYETHLMQLHDSSKKYEDLKNLANQYLDLLNSKLPEVIKQQEEYNSKIKSMNKKKLEDTRAVEDKIVSMLKKNQEEKIKLLEKENKTREDILRKRKEEYDAARKEVDYQNDYHKKLKEIEKLKKKLLIYSRDNSQYGQKQYQKTQEALEKAQEDLSKSVGRHVDDNVHKIIDDEIKRQNDVVSNEREKITDKTDAEYLKEAKKAIETGQIKNAQGEMVNLQSALIDYFNKFENGLSATGALIKGEIIGQLEVANNTVKEFSTILNTLGVARYAASDYMQSGEFNSIAEKSNSTLNQNINAPMVNIQGNVTPGMEAEITNAIRKALDEFTRNFKTRIN